MNNDNNSVADCVDHILMALNMIADMAQNDPQAARGNRCGGNRALPIISRAELILNSV